MAGCQRGQRGRGRLKMRSDDGWSGWVSGFNRTLEVFMPLYIVNSNELYVFAVFIRILHWSIPPVNRCYHFTALTKHILDYSYRHS